MVDEIKRVFGVLLDALRDFGALVMGLGRQAGALQRGLMTNIGVPPTVQTVVLVALAVLVVLLLLRVFAPILRVLPILFLVVIALQFLNLRPAPAPGRRASLACSAAA